MERPLSDSHPDAKFQGGSWSITKEIPGGTPLTITVQIDNRDPSQWGTHPVILMIEPIVSETRFSSLAVLAQLSWVFNGPLGDLIREVLLKIDHDLVPRPC